MNYFGVLCLFAVIYCSTSQIISSRNFIVKLETQDFAGAVLGCMSFGTEVATISSASNQLELEELLSNSAVGTNNLYIGYKRNSGSTSFSWQDASTSTFTNWDTVPASGTTERCTQAISSGLWQDIACSTTGYYVCNRPALTESANYVILPPRMSFDEAKTFCEMSIGTELATIESIADRDELGQLENSISSYFYVWLGLNDIEVEGTEEWLDGTTYVENGVCTPTFSNTDEYDCTYLSAEYYYDCWEWHYCEDDFNSPACNKPRTATSTNYVSVDAFLPFASANAYCEEVYGTTLATISSISDNNEVANLIFRTSTIGYNDREVENTFEWVSGTSSYENWCTGEPNDFQNREDCTIIFRNSNQNNPGCWRDNDCASSRAFVCNYNS